MSYKKAYDKMGVYSEAAEKKMKKSSNETAEEIEDDAKEMGQSHKKNSEIASSSWKSAFSVMGSVAGAGLKVFTAGVTAAATGVAALSASAVSGYADYEQLIGGVETLFGTAGLSLDEYARNVGQTTKEAKDEYRNLFKAQKEVFDNADEAYKTAGLSANEYMETVTSFSASLIQSLNGDTVAAAEKADQAIVDMSDNANKMGSSMESIQNAYQGFAKQNYTMLDNLKLGYGGTKEEMQRLLDDATAISGIKYNLSSYADVVDAIHIIQEEMGIAGTTAKEASETISGSVSAMKSAWSNLVTGIADENANFDELIDNFVDSVGVAAENILPRVEVAINGVGKLIEELLPVAIDSIPGIIDNVLPNLVQSGINIINSLVQGLTGNANTITESVFSIINSLVNAFVELLPTVLEMGCQILQSLMQGIIDNLPMIFENVMIMLNSICSTIQDWLPELIVMGLQMIMQLAMGLADAIPELIPVIVDILLQMVETLIDNIDMLVDVAITLIMALADGLIAALPILIEKAPVIIMKLVDALIKNVPKLLEAAWELIITLREGLFTYLPQLLAKIPELVKSINDKFVEFAKYMLEAGKHIIERMKEGICNNLAMILDSIASWMKNIKDKFIDKISEYDGIGEEIIDKIKDGLVDNISNILDKIPGLSDDVKEKFIEAVSDFADIGKNIINGIWSGISDGWDWLLDKVAGLAGDMLSTTEKTLEIHSPSRKFAYIGEMCVAGFDKGIEGLMDPQDMTKNINASLSTMQRNVVGGSVGGSTAGYGTFNQTINVNQQIATPDELARTMRIEARYGLMKGVPIGQHG